MDGVSTTPRTPAPPDPDDAVRTGPAPARRRPPAAGILVVVLALVAALVLVVVTAAVVVYQRHAGHSTVQSGAAASATPTGQARAAQARRSAAAAEFARIRARQQASDTRDEIATNGGWQVWDPGSVYFVLIDGTCPASAAACAFVEVLPLDGCPSGLTVEGPCWMGRRSSPRPPTSSGRWARASSVWPASSSRRAPSRMTSASRGSTAREPSEAPHPLSYSNP